MNLLGDSSQIHRLKLAQALELEDEVADAVAVAVAAVDFEFGCVVAVAEFEVLGDSKALDSA